MANVEATKSNDLSPQDRKWDAAKLVPLGALTLFIALSIIIYMGSHLGGCMYLDGSQ